MTRLGATMLWDVRLQLRQGFYYAAAFVVVVCLALLSQLGRETLAWGLPLVVLSNVITNTFYFLGGLLLLEKREGTLEAQVVTPLRDWEYLLSKVATLTGLSLVENLLIVAVAHGAGFDALRLIAGILIASAMLALFGFLVVVRYDSINEYLMPSVIYTSLLGAPFLPFFGVGERWWFYPHPVHAPLELMRTAFGGGDPWTLPYGLLYGSAWTVVLFVLCRRAFSRFVVAREGASE